MAVWLFKSLMTASIFDDAAVVAEFTASHLYLVTAYPIFCVLDLSSH